VTSTQAVGDLQRFSATLSVLRAGQVTALSVSFTPFMDLVAGDFVSMDLVGFTVDSTDERLPLESSPDGAFGDATWTPRSQTLVFFVVCPHTPTPHPQTLHSKP